MPFREVIVDALDNLVTLNALFVDDKSKKANGTVLPIPTFPPVIINFPFGAVDTPIPIFPLTANAVPGAVYPTPTFPVPTIKLFAATDTPIPIFPFTANAVPGVVYPMPTFPLLTTNVLVVLDNSNNPRGDVVPIPTFRPVANTKSSPDGVLISDVTPEKIKLPVMVSPVLRTKLLVSVDEAKSTQVPLMYPCN